MGSILVIAIIINAFAFLCPLCVTIGDDHHSKGILDLFLGAWKCRCGVPNREARILGGEALKVHEYPWLASIHISGIYSVPGTLINDKYVITLASLLTGLTPSDVKVNLGLLDRCSSGTTSTNHSVTSIILHSEFSQTDGAHNVALVKLNGNVNFEKSTSTICLASFGKTYVGEVATVVGWPGSRSECRQRKIGLPVLSRRECFSTVANRRFFSIDKGCVGVIGATSGLCKGDAGSPVMHRDNNGIYELIGILSDNNICGGMPSTSMYTKVYDHIQWINDNTQDGRYCFKF